MTKVLVTGGAGFIGSYLTKRLIEENYEVMVIDNLSFGKREFVHEKAKFYNIDIREKESLKNLLFEFHPKIVFHLAALHFIPYCNEHPVETIEVNAMGTKNLLSYLKELKIEKLFFASTAAVYPPSDNPHKETDDIGPIDIYGISKVLGEDIVKLFSYTTGIKSVVGRFFNAYGPNETNPHLIPVIVSQLKLGKRSIELGNLHPKRDFIHTKDMCEAVIKLTLNFERTFDIFNIGSGKEYSVEEVVQTFSKILKEEIKIIQKEGLIRKVERNHLVADITKIKEEICWQPSISFYKGLEELIK